MTFRFLENLCTPNLIYIWSANLMYWSLTMTVWQKPFFYTYVIIPLIQKFDYVLKFQILMIVEMMKTVFVTFSHDCSPSNSWCSWNFVLQVVEGLEMNVNEQAGWHLSKQWDDTECFVCVRVHACMHMWERVCLCVHMWEQVSVCLATSVTHCGHWKYPSICV